MIKRIYGRVCIVLAVLAMLFVLITPIAAHFSLVLTIVFAVLSSVSIIAITIVKSVFMKCPGCGKSAVPLQWSKSGTRYCSLCGECLVYDK